MTEEAPNEEVRTKVPNKRIGEEENKNYACAICRPLGLSAQSPSKSLATLAGGGKGLGPQLQVCKPLRSGTTRSARPVHPRTYSYPAPSPGCAEPKARPPPSRASTHRRLLSRPSSVLFLNPACDRCGRGLILRARVCVYKLYGVTLRGARPTLSGGA